MKLEVIRGSVISCWKIGQFWDAKLWALYLYVQISKKKYSYETRKYFLEGCNKSIWLSRATLASRMPKIWALRRCTLWTFNTKCCKVAGQKKIENVGKISCLCQKEWKIEILKRWVLMVGASTIHPAYVVYT